MHDKNKDKKFYMAGKMSFKWLLFLTVLSRAILKTQPEVYGGSFLQE